jgi:hypothetical protein
MIFFSGYIMARTSYIQWTDDDDICFVLDQHAFYCASSLKQQSAGRHLSTLTHYSDSKPTQPVFALSRA